MKIVNLFADFTNHNVGMINAILAIITLFAVLSSLYISSAHHEFKKQEKKKLKDFNKKFKNEILPNLEKIYLDFKPVNKETIQSAALSNNTSENTVGKLELINPDQELIFF